MFLLSPQAAAVRCPSRLPPPFCLFPCLPMWQYLFTAQPPPSPTPPFALFSHGALNQEGINADDAFTVSLHPSLCGWISRWQRQWGETTDVELLSRLWGVYLVCVCGREGLECVDVCCFHTAATSSWESCSLVFICFKCCHVPNHCLLKL